MIIRVGWWATKWQSGGKQGTAGEGSFSPFGPFNNNIVGGEKGVVRIRILLVTSVVDMNKCTGVRE